MPYLISNECFFFGQFRVEKKGVFPVERAYETTETDIVIKQDILLKTELDENCRESSEKTRLVRSDIEHPGFGAPRVLCIYM